LYKIKVKASDSQARSEIANYIHIDSVNGEYIEAVVNEFDYRELKKNISQEIEVLSVTDSKKESKASCHITGSTKKIKFSESIYVKKSYPLQLRLDRTFKNLDVQILSIEHGEGCEIKKLTLNCRSSDQILQKIILKYKDQKETFYLNLDLNYF